MTDPTAVRIIQLLYHPPGSEKNPNGPYELIEVGGTKDLSLDEIHRKLQRATEMVFRDLLRTSIIEELRKQASRVVIPSAGSLPPRIIS